MTYFWFSGLLVGVLLIRPIAVSAEAIEPTIIHDQLPGMVQGEGTEFNVTSSDYLNVGLVSTEPVSIYMQSIPEIVTIFVDKNISSNVAEFTLSGLKPGATYYQYEDNFHNLIEFTTDENGQYSYKQDLSENHFIIIQSHKSTKFIKDDVTGGDCTSIGTWDQATKTCTLTTDVTETIQVDSDGITLDGNNHSQRGLNNWGFGVYADLHNRITVKNFSFSNLGIGVLLSRSEGSVVIDSTFTNNSQAIYLLYADNGVVQGNKISNNGIAGAGIKVARSGHAIVENNEVSGGSTGINLENTFENVIRYNSVASTNFRNIRLRFSSKNEIYNNNFINDPGKTLITSAFGNTFTLDVPIGGNYWSSFDSSAEGCNDNNNDKFCDQPYQFSGGIDNLPWIEPITNPPELPTEPETTAVLFIPGLQGNRLYVEERGAEKQLWEPDGTSAIQQLFLDEQGNSIRDGIYTRDIIDETYGYNIYKKFSQFMDSLVEEETIAQWRPIPYDWRFDAADHVPKVVAELESLATDTDSVTIIAHSNGGLIAKSVLQELERQKAAGEGNLIDDIDRLILVAVPQLGTPQTIPSLLHGYDLDYGKGLLLNKALARALARHMPSAFSLLPSDDYFTAVLDAPVEFDMSADRFVPFRSLYGPTINSTGELRSLLTGGNDTWTQPSLSDVVSPLVLEEHFLDTAAGNQAAWSDWSPPPTMGVIQIAGWGLDTVRTVRYTAKKVLSCGDLSPTFCRDGYKLDIEPVFTADGDETVVTPSAMVMEGYKYYVHLVNHNRELHRFRRNRDHASILEVEPLQDLIENILTGDDAFPNHITDIKPPVDEEGKRLRVSVHSPVSLRVCSETRGDDGQPLCTGLEPIPGSDLMRKVEDIANSYYMEFGEGKYVGFSADEPHTIALEGEDAGTFSLVVDEVAGDEVVGTLQYNNVPVAEGVTAELTVQDVSNATPLQLDVYGVEVVLQPGEELTARQLVDVLAKIVDELPLRKGAHKSTEAHIKNVAKFLDSKRVSSQAIASQLKNIVKKVQQEVGTSITQEEADRAIQVVGMIEVHLGL